MKKNIGRVTLLLFIVLLLSTIIGCGRSSNSTSSPNPQPSVSSQEASAPNTQSSISSQETSIKSDTIPTNNQDATSTSTTTQTSKASTNTQNVAASPSSQANDDDITVYITKTGTKYHVYGCRSLSKSKIPVSLAAAKARGYEPCGICHPPQ